MIRSVHKLLVLLETAQQHDLLSMTGTTKLNRLEAMQQLCRHAGQEAPALEDFAADVLPL
jgi:hypothetical protein